MLKQERIDYKNYANDVLIECPICNLKKKLRIPIKIINQSKQLTTVSIPKGLVCQHNFQAFIDKNFKIRGYQKVDYDFSLMEFYEGSLNSFNDRIGEEQRTEDNLIRLSSSIIFQKFITLLRDCVDNDDIIGSALFTLEGNVLYSSLPLNILNNIMREFEVRKEKNLVQVEKYFLVLANKQKIFSQFFEIDNTPVIITLIFSKTVRLGMGDLRLRDLINKIQKMNEV